MSSEMEQVRLSLGAFHSFSNTWNVVVFFATPIDSISDEELPLVRIITEEGENLFFEGTIDSFQHTRDEANSGIYGNQSNLYYQSPWLCKVLLSELNPCQAFSYKIGFKGVSDRFKSTKFSFRTPPVPGSTCVIQNFLRLVNEAKKEEMRIAVVGDIGQTEFSQNTRDIILKRHKKAHYTAMILVGDIAYADGDLNRWDSWGRLFEPLTARLPLMTLPGNHELELDIEGNSFVPYRKRFFMPEVAPEAIAKSVNVSKIKVDEYRVSLKYDFGSSFYSFNLGRVHFVMLNTYDSYSYFNEEENIQKTWFEQDLLQVDRDVTPFIVVCAHAPIYSSSDAHQGEFASEKTAAWIEPLLRKFEVELFLSGHVHAYERTRKIGSTVFITIGDGGNHEELYHNWTDYSFSEFRDGRFYGHGELIVMNRTHLKWIFSPNPEQEGAIVNDEIVLTSNYLASEIDFEAQLILINQYGILLLLVGIIVGVIFSKRRRTGKASLVEIQGLLDKPT